MRIRFLKYVPKSTIPILLIASLITSVIGSIPLVYADGPTTNNEHLITIHDRGKDRSIISKHDTLRETFKEAGITLDPNDMVEPGLDEKLANASYQVNVYRARPINIVDGMHHIRVMSAYQTPRQVAEHAGISLHDEDKTSLSLSKHMVADGASLELSIDRATPVKFVLYGKKDTLYTQATTVADFLHEKDIKLGPKDTVSKKGDVVIEPNMKIEVWREGKQTLTKNESIPFATQIIHDANRDISYKKIKQAGTKGRKTVTYEIMMHNGKEVKRKKIQSVVIKKPTDQITVVGTKVHLPSGSHEDWMGRAGISSGDYGYVNYIFSNESGWNPSARNPAGYVGLGQTSESNLSGSCSSWQSDPICQIKFFNGYAVSRYGSWSDAYDFKASKGWW